MELELVVVFVVGEHLDVIIEHVPRHINWVELSTPAMESRCPEVHAQALWFIHMCNGRVMKADMAHFMPINNPRNVMRGPFHLICVPVIMRVESMSIIVRFKLLMAIAVDNIHGEWALLDRWHNLHVKLVPLVRVKVWPVPVCEERGDRSFSVRCLHASDKLAVPEFLESRDGATAELLARYNSKQ